MVDPADVRRKRLGLVAVAITGCAAIGLCAISLPFVTPALRKHCLPYVPATTRQTQNVISMCKFKQNRQLEFGPACEPALGESDVDCNDGKENECLIDLGSGDGRIVLEAAKHGIMSTGVELNFWLVLYSKMSARINGLSRLANFQRIDLWKTDLSKYDNIVIFGVAEMMPVLKEKLMIEAKPNANIIACRFPIPSWRPMKSIDEGIDSVWLYSKSTFNLDDKLSPATKDT